MNYPVLIYVTKAKPFLSLDLNPQSKTYRLYRLSEHPDPSKKGEDDQDLNGLVCFECECKEAFDFSEVVNTNTNLSLKIRNVFESEEVSFRGLKTALTLKQIEDYQGQSKTLYALHFENIKAIDEPFPITELFSDEWCTKPLTTAPQSWAFAYRKTIIDNDLKTVLRYPGRKDTEVIDCGNGKLAVIEKYLVFSIQSTWCCKFVNGEKDLEIRTRCPKEIKGGK